MPNHSDHTGFSFTYPAYFVQVVVPLAIIVHEKVANKQPDVGGDPEKLKEKRAIISMSISIIIIHNDEKINPGRLKDNNT